VWKEHGSKEEFDTPSWRVPNELSTKPFDEEFQHSKTGATQTELSSQKTSS